MSNVRFPTRQRADNLLALTKGHAQKPLALQRMGFPGFRPRQEEVVNRIMACRDVLCILATGGGKCLAEDTPVILYDGTVVPVQNIKVGDLLLGPDSVPRTVTSLARGRQEMFRVTPARGDAYTVNRDHILSLKITGIGKGKRVTADGVPYGSGAVVNIAVKDYVRQSQTFKHCAKGWMPDGVVFGESVLPHPDLPPRILGMWLGDGGYDRPVISKPDDEVLQIVEAYAESIGAKVSVSGEAWNPSIYLGFPDDSNGCAGGSNRMVNALREVGVWKNKHIPDSYLKGSKRDRLELLAGLLDTDGHLDLDHRGYEITMKQEALIRQIVFLARSLGFRASYKEKAVQLPGWEAPRIYFRAHIYGQLWRIPCAIPRKRASEKVRQKDVTMVGIKVESVGEGDYYGFELAGPDRLFLLGDFTVTHNTACFVIPSLCMGWATVVFSPLQALMRDQVRSLQERGIPAARVTADQNETMNDMALEMWMRHDLQFLYVSPERQDNPKFKHAMAVRPLEHMVVDEAHCLHQWSQTFRPAYRHLGDFAREMDPQVISAFTATCPPEVMADIMLVLGMANAEVLEFYSRRNNLNLSSSQYPGDNAFIDWVIDLEGSAIVYCSSQKRCEQLAEMADLAIQAQVDEWGNPGEAGQVTYYHADVPPSAKELHMSRFMSGKARIVFATNAFGMGIDKSNIRHVIHRDLPGTPEALSQEIGRAGRDDQPSWCHLFFDKRSVSTQEWFIDQQSPSEDTVRHVFGTLERICKQKDNGVASLTNMELATAAGFATAGGYQDREAANQISAVLTLLNAHRIIEKHEEKDTKAYVQFVEDLTSVTPMFIQHRDKIYELGVEEGDRIAFDLAALATAMHVEQKTVQNRLRQWANGSGYIKYWGPAKSRPIRIVGDIESLPWDEVRARREDSYQKLHEVVRYANTPDKDKQQALEEMMGYQRR